MAKAQDAPVNIGQALEAERLRRGISQDDAAPSFGVSQATFSRWVKGQSLPSSRYWTKIGRFLHTSRDDVARIVGAQRLATPDEARLDALEAEVRKLRELMVQVAIRVGVEP